MPAHNIIDNRNEKLADLEWGQRRDGRVARRNGGPGTQAGVLARAPGVPDARPMRSEALEERPAV